MGSSILSSATGYADVKVIVSTDLSALKPGMQEAKEEIRSLGNETESVAGKMRTMEQASNVLRDEVSGLSGEFNELVSVALRFGPAVGLVGVAAVGAFALAVKAGADESQRLGAALIMSGNAIGMTAGQMQDMASQVADSSRVTGSSIANVMEQLIQSGNVGADSIGKVSLAAVLLEKYGGVAIKQTVSELAKLGDEPTKASAELNKHYNYLTASIFEQIKALEDQGRVTEAAKMAQEAYADATISRSDELRNNLGTLQQAWDSVAGAAKSAWDRMMDAGRRKSIADLIAEVKQDIDRGTTDAYGGDSAAKLALANLEARADAEGKAAKAAGERVAQERASIQWQQEGDKYLDKQAQKLRDIAKAKELAVQAGVSEVELASRLAAIEEKYADKSKAKTPKVDRDEQAVDKLRLEGRAADAGLAPNTLRELDSLSVVYNKTNMAQEEYLRLAGVAMANDAVIAARKRAIASELKAEAEATQYLNELQGKFDRSNQAKLDSMAALPENVARLNAELRKVDENAADARNRLARMHGDGKLSAEDYAEKLQELNGLIENQKDQVRALNVQQDHLNESWEVGATRALIKYQDAATNVAKTTEDAFTSAFRTMEDGIVSYAATGKVSIKSMAQSILADLSRIYARQAMMGMVRLGASLVGSYFQNNVGATAGLQQSATGAYTTTDGIYVDVAHSGGLVGESGFARRGISPAMFAGAQRFHNGGWPGLGSDEVPIIAQRGERVLNREESAAWSRGGSNSVQISINQYFTGSGTGSDQASSNGSGSARQLGEMVANTCRTVIVQEMRSGGLLSKVAQS